jgi:hypothetical protein
MNRVYKPKSAIRATPTTWKSYGDGLSEKALTTRIARLESNLKLLIIDPTSLTKKDP